MWSSCRSNRRKTLRFTRSNPAEPLLSLSLASKACAPILARHAPEPIARGVAARHVIELNKSAQPFVVPQNAQILQRPSTASKHEN